EEDLLYRPVDFSFRLKDGINVLAAEVHQWDAASTDLLFDAELLCPISRGPYLQNATPTAMLVRWRTPLPTSGFVRFGTNLNNLTDVVAEDENPHVDHSLLLTNLLP